MRALLIGSIKKITPWTDFGIFVLANAGIYLSIYLWYSSIDSGPVPCTVNGGCADVLKSEWSRVFDVPVAVFGLFFYMAIGFVSYLKLSIQHKLLKRSLLLLILGGIAFSLYLRYLEFFKIGALCIWCWVSVLLVVLITVLFLIEHNASKFE